MENRWFRNSVQVGRPKNQEYEGRRSVSQLKLSGREWVQLSSAFLFYSGPQIIGWCLPALGKAICFNLSTIKMILSSRNTLIDTLRVMFNQLAGHLVMQGSWHIKLNITLVIASLDIESLIMVLYSNILTNISCCYYYPRNVLICSEVKESHLDCNFYLIYICFWNENTKNVVNRHITSVLFRKAT